MMKKNKKCDRCDRCDRSVKGKYIFHTHTLLILCVCLARREFLHFTGHTGHNRIG